VRQHRAHLHRHRCGGMRRATLRQPMENERTDVSRGTQQGCIHGPERLPRVRTDIDLFNANRMKGEREIRERAIDELIATPNT
jgi:hypothetical protein